MNQFLTSFLLLTSIALHAVTVDAHEIPKRSLLRGSSNTNIVQADDSNHRQKREAQMEERGASASMDEEYEDRGDSLSQDEDCEGMDCEPFGSEDSLDEDYEDEEEESFDFTKEDIGMMSNGMQMMMNDPPASYGTDGKYKDEEEEDVTIYEDNNNGKTFTFEEDFEEEDLDLGPEEGEDLMESFDFDFEDKKKEVNDATGGEMMSPQEFEEFMEKQYEEQNQKEAMMGYEGEEEEEEEVEDLINSVGAMLNKGSSAKMGVSGMTEEEYEDYMAGLA